MKNQIPTPAVIAALVIAAAIGIYALTQAGQSGPEFKPAPPTGKTPEHILNQMPPQQRAQIEAEEAKAGISDDKIAQQKAVQPQGNPYGQR